MWGWITPFILLTIPFALLVPEGFSPRVDHPALIPIALWSLLAGFFAARKVARRDDVSWEEMGIRRDAAASDLLLGFAIGLANFMLFLLPAALLGWVTIAPAAQAPAIAASLFLALLVLFPASAFEEVTSRGLPFALLAPRGPAPTIVITAILFTVLHLPNPGIDALGALGVFAAGICLGIARHRSCGLWLPIGWHAGWNFAQGALFGCVVSGLLPASAPAFPVRLDGPRALVGGSFGPEAGLLAILADLATILVYIRLIPPRTAVLSTEAIPRPR